MTKKSILWLLVNICRLLVAATFIFSGIVKIIDPRGTEYKLQDYADAFGLGFLLPSYTPLILAIALAVIEFRIGIHTLFGISRRKTSKLALAFMLVFTPLTLYIAIAEPVSDCGCFGDALYLTGWQTFFKNVVLLVAVIILICWPHKQMRLVSRKHQWLLSIYSLVFSILLACYNIYRLPIIDFRPYHVGADIQQAMTPDETAEFNTLFLMEKDGEQRLFTIEDYPDSTWTFIDTQTEQVGEMKKPEIDNLQIVTLEGEDITEELLMADGFKFLLVAPFLELADDGYMEHYNAIYDYAMQHGYRFYCLTASGEAGINRWADLTGAEYPFCHTDAITLKTMIRSNPGLMLLNGSVVVAKWPCSALPDFDAETENLDELGYNEPQSQSHIKQSVQLLLAYIIPLFTIMFVDRIWFGQRMFRAYRKKTKRKILFNQQKNKKQ